MCQLAQKKKELLVLYGLTWGVWVVIFNHMAESATFIIAVGSIVGFYLMIDKIKTVDYLLLGLMLLFTVFGPTDLYPASWRIWIVEKLQMKVFPVILIYVRMLYILVECIVNFNKFLFV